MTQDPYNPEYFVVDGPDFLDQHPTVFIRERGNIVPSWYQRHTEPRTTVVTQEGIPIPPGFTVAEVAPEFRWAIQEDGEVMPQLEFQRAHEIWYTEQYSHVGQPCDDPNLRPIPSVQRFVARRVNPNDPTRLEPITRDAETHERVQPLYNAQGDLVEEGGESKAPAGMSVKPVDEKEPAPKPKPNQPILVKQKSTPIYEDYKAPCGHPFPRGTRYLHLHTRRCGKDECVQHEIDRKAAKAAKEK